MSSECCVDPGSKQNHEAQGGIEAIGGIDTYKTGQGKSAIVLFTDVFGNRFLNAQKLADSFAQGSQTTVFIPDCFNGDPLDPNDPNLQSKLSGWLEKHPPSNACAIADKFLSTIKDSYQSIQLIGFCYGAKPVVHSIIDPQLSSIVKAAIVAHPSLLVEEEAKQIHRPILFLCAENDVRFPVDLRNVFEKELKSNGLGRFIEYPGTVHGFVVRPHGSEEVIQQRNKAVQDAIEYFKKNL